MTIEEKYLELRQNLWIQKIIDTCSTTLKTDQNLAYIALFKRRNKPQNVLNSLQDTSSVASYAQSN